MKFALEEAEQVVVELASTILADGTEEGRVRSAYGSGDGFDAQLWADLAASGLLGVGLPDEVGGLGLGVAGSALLLREAGRHVAPVPLLATLSASHLVDALGSRDQRMEILPAAARGERILTVAWHEPLEPPRRPATVARAVGDGWSLTGAKTNVPACHLATDVLVPARTASGRFGVFLLSVDGQGVRTDRQDVLGLEPQFALELTNCFVPAGRLLGDADVDEATFDALVDIGGLLVCAVSSGVAAEALRRTASYVRERHQFGRPIGSFQAVAHRLADAYVDATAMWMTTAHAVSLLEAARPAGEAIAIAKYWSCEGAHGIGHTALHVHGGVSMDAQFPIHRYFLWLKQLEFTLGPATPELVRIAAML